MDCEIIVIGGGVVGCAIARRLAKDGHQVVLLERHEPGAGASGAAAGMIAPQAEADSATPLLGLGLCSRALYPDWVAEVCQDSGIDPEFHQEGLVFAALSEEESSKLTRIARWQTEQGLPVERVDRSAMTSWFGGVGDEVCEGLLFPEDGHVHPRRLVEGLALATVRAGAEVRSGWEVRELILSGGRVRGVRGTDGLLEAEQVVLAAGCWSSRFAHQIPDLSPVEPVRGQLVELRSVNRTSPRILYASCGYVVPRGMNLVVGSTSERVGFDAVPTAAGVRDLLAVAERLLSHLGKGAFVSAWAGLRPGSPDDLPTIGFSEVPGLLLATGHYRSGVLLAPITAEIVSDLVEGRKSRCDLEPYRPGRHERVTPRPG